MGIKFDSKTNTWSAFYSKRHPVTRLPKSLRRINLQSQAEAKKVEKTLIVQVEQALLEKMMPTWPRLVNEYMEHKRIADWNEKSYQNCKICLEAHTFDKWRVRRIDSISPQDIKNLLNEKVGKTSLSNQQTLLKFIRGAFQYAVDSRIIPSNPCPSMRFKIGEKIKKVLTEQQARTLLEKAKTYEHEWYYHWALALYTGMRNGELYALTWDKVDLNSRTILVDAAWNKVDGLKETKSGNDRMVEIAPNLLSVLKELRLKQFDSHFVLPRSRNWDKGEQARMLRMFLIGIGLPPVRFHDLRASWATIMLSKGVEPAKVMIMGGWSSIKVMMIYMRKAGVSIRGITDGLDLHNPCAEEADRVSSQEA